MSEPRRKNLRSNGGPARPRSGVDWLISGCHRCYRYYSFHSRFLVRYHLLPTFPLLRFDLVASVYTSSPRASPLCRQNALWHMVRGSVQHLAGKSCERLLQWRRSCVPWLHGSTQYIGMCCVLCGGSGAVLAAGEQLWLRQGGCCFRSPGLRLAARLACASAHRPAACPSARHVGGLCMGLGFAAASARQAGDLRAASPAPRPAARRLAHWLWLCSACLLLVCCRGV